MTKVIKKRMSKVLHDNKHPSFFSLDVMALDSTDVSDNHISTCAQCQNYIAKVQSDGEVPRWVEDLASIPGKVGKDILANHHSDRRQPLPWSRAIRFALCGGVALALLLVMVGKTDTSTRGQMVAKKGDFFVSVYIKRGLSVRLWDGVELIYPGDKIRLQLGGTSDYRHVAVFTETSESGQITHKKLFGMEVNPEQATTALPVAWEVDADSESEVLQVVLGYSPIAEDVRTQVSNKYWMKTIVLPKQIQEQIEGMPTPEVKIEVTPREKSEARTGEKTQ